MTADELLIIARREKPHIRYTKNKAGTALAAWKDGRWQTVAMLLIGGYDSCNGQWGSVGDLLVNGEPVNPQADWLPVAELPLPIN